MRKLVFTLLMLLTLSLNAQVKFMGIPIDGTKMDMISKIEQKGFVYNVTDDCFTGEFNGSNVHVYIVTNKDKVYRIAIIEDDSFNESQIKIRFNNLIKQFESSGRYSFMNDNQYLDESFDISYEIMVNNKAIQASFAQKYTEKEKEFIINNTPSLQEFGKEEQDLILDSAALYNNAVWFAISKLQYKDEYRIAIYYDNFQNAPNGEDL